jgi:transporter family protein
VLLGPRAMIEINLVLLAAAVAAIMALLVREGKGPSLRAAIRTTLVLLLAWALAYKANSPVSWSLLSWRVWLMLALSAAAVGLAWGLHLFEPSNHESTACARADKINVFIAAGFAVLLILGSAPQRYLFAAMLVCGTAVLAARRA